MQIHADLTQPAVVDATTLPWLPSPMAGVERRMLERDGAESGRATSVVRYAAGSSFARHRHPLGEEILVLDGVFSDEQGDHGPGSYLKNPPGSAHSPASAPGCTLFVKLHHMHADDRQTLAIDTRRAAWQPGPVAGLSVLPLSSFGAERTVLQRWAPGTALAAEPQPGGEEIFIVDGSFDDDSGHHAAGCWLRHPHGGRQRRVGRDGCTVLVKTGHLRPGA